MESPFDISALAPISGSASGPVVALRNNTEPRAVRPSSHSDSAATISLEPLSAGGSASVAFDPVQANAGVRTLAELDKFAQREEGNRAAIQARLEALAESMTGIQRNKTFLSILRGG